MMGLPFGLRLSGRGGVGSSNSLAARLFSPRLTADSVRCLSSDYAEPFELQLAIHAALRVLLGIIYYSA